MDGGEEGPLLVTSSDHGLFVYHCASNQSNSPIFREVQKYKIDEENDDRLPNYSSKATSCVRWYQSGKLFAVLLRNGILLFRHHDDFHIIDTFQNTPPTTKKKGIQSNGGEDGEGYCWSCLSVSGGMRYMAVGGGKEGEGVLRVWDMKIRKMERFWMLDDDVKSIAFQTTMDSRYVAAACGSYVYLYSRVSGRLVERYEIYGDNTSGSSSNSVGSSGGGGVKHKRIKVSVVTWSPKNVNLLVAADDNGNVYIWDVARKGVESGKGGRGALWGKFGAVFKAPATCLDFSPTGKHFLYVGGLDKQIRIYDLNKKRLIKSIHCPSPLLTLSCSGDGLSLAAGSSSGAVYIYDLQSECITPQTIIKLPKANGSKSVSGSSHSVATDAVRSVSFQPKHGSVLAAEPKTPRTVFSPRKAALQTPFSREGAAHESTANGVSTGARESDIFSPIAATPRNVVPKTNLRNPIDMNGVSTEPDSGKRSQLARFMNNRRESEMIPSTGKGVSFSDNEAVIPERSFDSFTHSEKTEFARDETFRDDELGRASSGIGIRKSRSSEDYCMVLSPVMEEDSQGGDSGEEMESSRDGGKSGSKMRSATPRKPRQNLGVTRSKSDESRRRNGMNGMHAPSGLHRDESIESNYSGIRQDDSNLSQMSGHEQNRQPYRSGLAMQPERRGDNYKEANMNLGVIRGVIEEEIDVLREDLRSDIINLHTEVIMSFARQAEDLKRSMDLRDVELHALREELTAVKAENRRLRRYANG